MFWLQRAYNLRRNGTLLIISATIEVFQCTNETCEGTIKSFGSDRYSPPLRWITVNYVFNFNKQKRTKLYLFSLTIFGFNTSLPVGITRLPKATDFASLSLVKKCSMMWWKRIRMSDPDLWCAWRSFTIGINTPEPGHNSCLPSPPSKCDTRPPDFSGCKARSVVFCRKSI